MQKIFTKFKKIHIIIRDHFIKSNLEKMGLQFDTDKFSINEDGTVDVDGDLNISCRGLTKLLVKFGTIYGYFDCSYNNLETLENAPHTVEGYFICSKNKLTNLQFSPKIVTGNFECDNNKITSLLGSPRILPGSFNCSSNQLTNLQFCPEKIGGNLYSIVNIIDTLEYLPKTVSGNVLLENNRLKDLKTLNKMPVLNSLTIGHNEGLFLDRGKKYYPDEIAQEMIVNEVETLTKELDKEPEITTKRKMKI